MKYPSTLDLLVCMLNGKEGVGGGLNYTATVNCFHL